MEILLGIEFFFEIIQNGKLVIPDLPSFQWSKFGWLVAGRASIDTNTFTSFTNTRLNFNNRLNQLQSKFWEIENLPVK